MRKTLAEEPRIEIVGEAATFDATMRMISDFKPEVLLLDLHMPEKREFTPDFVKIVSTFLNFILLEKGLLSHDYIHSV